MEKRITMNLLNGKYSEVEKICKNIDIIMIRDIMLNIAYDTENICVYSFIQYMIKKTGDKNWISLAKDLMLNSFCHVEGAYSVALFHARELLELERNVENLESLLFFYNMPEKLLGEDEAQYLAKEILKLEPDNKVALAI